MTKESVSVLKVFASGPIDYQEELYSEKCKVYKIRAIFRAGSLYYEIFFHSLPIRKYIHRFTLDNLRGIHHINKYGSFSEIGYRIEPFSIERELPYLKFQENPVCWYVGKGLHGAKMYKLFSEFGKLLQII